MRERTPNSYKHSGFSVLLKQFYLDSCKHLMPKFCGNKPFYRQIRRKSEAAKASTRWNYLLYRQTATPFITVRLPVLSLNPSVLSKFVLSPPCPFVTLPVYITSEFAVTLPLSLWLSHNSRVDCKNWESHLRFPWAQIQTHQSSGGDSYWLTVRD